jgi:hypothetical protein
MRRTILLVSTATLVLAACGQTTQRTQALKPPPPGFHLAHLAEGESAEVAAELTEVPGYFYQDVSAEELESELEMVSPLEPLGASFHGVRQASSGDEIAFLTLVAVDPTDAVHSSAYEDRFPSWLTGRDEVVRTAFSGQTVFLAEDPSHPMSRYQYVWDRHGTFGMVDSPDRVALEGWLAAYLATPVVLPGENLDLVERLVPISGFTYTNESRLSLLGPCSSSDRSAHQVLDANHAFGTVILVGPEPGFGERDFVACFSSLFTQVLGTKPLDVGESEIRGIAVHRWSSDPDGDGITMFTWMWSDGIGGELATERPDIGEPFLRALLSARTL